MEAGQEPEGDVHGPEDRREQAHEPLYRYNASIKYVSSTNNIYHNSSNHTIM